MHSDAGITLRCSDCIEVMREYDDGYFDLAVVDPPYGIGAGKFIYSNQFVPYKIKDWDEEIPNQSYFKELFRVSKKQIIFGGNYFPLPLNNSWLFWDKGRPNSFTYSAGELAWTNFLSGIKKAPILYNGAAGADKVRIHPTQKPVRLYDWIFENYAHDDDKILDTHLGSGSSAISAKKRGLNFVGCEIDEEYYLLMLERYFQETAQNLLF